MKRLTDEELSDIKERIGKARGNPITEFDVLKAQDRLAHIDAPNLIAEVEVLNRLVGHYKGYVDRFSDDITEYKKTIRNLDALAESVRYQLGREQDAESVADEIIDIISELERKVGEII